MKYLFLLIISISVIISRAEARTSLANGSNQKPFIEETIMAAKIISKRCPKCKKIKPISEFYKNRTTKDKYHTQCKECKLQWSRNDYKEHKNGKYKKYRLNMHKRSINYKIELIKKLGGKCSICGYSDLSCPAVFDFHHGKEKTINITNIINKYRASAKCRKLVEEDLPSCQLVCSNCHRKIHFSKYASLMIGV